MMRPLKLELDDVDFDAGSTSLTWSVDADGNIRHKLTDTRVSSKGGITFEGQEHQLSPDDINVGSPIASGFGGSVQKGIVKGGGSRVAIKTIRMDDKDKRDQLLREIRGLTVAEGCPYLVQWYAAFASKRSFAVHVVLEFMDMGSLADLNRRLGGGGVPVQNLSCITMQMARGLEHLHDKRLMHRDIKPQNVLHNCLGEVKLTDFGLTKVLEDRLARTMTPLGTQTYMSPERVRGDSYCLSSDIWSLGMVVYEMATGQFPFAIDIPFIALLTNLCDGPEPRLDIAEYPAAVCSFVESCLLRDALARPDISSLVCHEFVSHDVGSLEIFATWLAVVP